MAKEENAIFASSLCGWRFVGVMVGVPDVKSLVQHDGECYKSWKRTVFKIFFIRAIPTYRVYRLYDNQYSQQLAT